MIQANRNDDPLSILETRDLSKVFNVKSGLMGANKVVAVDNVNVKINTGEIVGVVGASGSGKSTLARLLVLLYRPTSGKIVFNGEDITAIKGKKLKEYRRNIQMVFQDPYASLDPNHTVEWHIKRPLIINGTQGNINEKINELLDLVKLSPPSVYREKFPHQLSGGQRQRVFLARTLAVDPKILIADEPVSMLDVSVRVEILEVLQSLRERLAVSIFYITHDLNTVGMITDRIYVMHNGKVVESGSTETVLNSPSDEYTRKLIDATPDPYKRIMPR